MERVRGAWEAHSRRACDLGLLLAEAVVPSDAGDPEMVAGFLLHDVGKIEVPDAILCKPGALTPAELDVVRRHPQAGWRILDEAGFSARARDVVLHHHERWDGRGYPHGLRGEQIPLWARLFAVADAVEAMTSDRPYRRALTLHAALAELRSEAGRQFDPACVAAFLRLDRRRIRAILDRTRYAAARGVASKSVRGIGPTHGELAPALR